MSDIDTGFESWKALPLPAPDRVILNTRATFNWYHSGDEGICSLSVLFEGGSCELSPAVQQLLVTMLIEGSRDIDADRIASRLDYYGARFTPVLSSHYTGFTITALTANAGDVFSFMAEVMAAPLFPQKRLATAKEQLKAAVRISSQEVMNVAAEKMLGLVAGRKHPFAQALTIESVDKVDSDTLAQVYAKNFNGNACTAFLGGSLTGEAVYGARQLVEVFQPGATSPQIEVTPFAPELPGVRCFDPKNRQQVAVSAGIPLQLPRTNEDYTALRVVVAALGGYFGSRLMTEIRERRGLTYGIQASLAGIQDGTYVTITANCSPQSRAALLDEVKNQMRLMVENPPAGAELRRIRMYMLTSALQTLDSASGINSYNVTAKLVGIPQAYFMKQQEIALAITPEQISGLAARYLQPSELRVAVSG